MLNAIYCCRFEQRGRRAVLVVLSAAAPRILQLRCTTADGRNVSDPTVFWRQGLAVRAAPCLSGNRNGLDSLNAYPPLRRKSAACGAAAPAPRALSLEPLPPCNVTGPHVSWQSPPHAQAGT